MQNDGRYFIRTELEGEPLSKESPKAYPEEIFQFGSIDLELFAHAFDGQWHASERKTGVKIGQGPDMQAAMDDAHRCIDEIGGPEKFLEMIKGVVQRLNDGQKYDYEKREWAK